MRKNTLITIAVAISLVVAGGGTVMAAAPSEDTETTDTTTTSQISSTYTQTYSETGDSRLAFSADSNDTAVTVWQGSTGTGTQLATYEQNESGVLEYQTVATGTYYINGTFADDASDYPGIEADAGETVTVTAEMINRADDPDTNTNLSYSFTAGANTSFIRFNDSETQTAEAGFVASTLSSVPFIGSGNATGAADVDQDIGVNGADQDEIVVYVANGDAQDSAQAVYNASDESNGVTYTGVAQVDGEYVPVMAEGADAPDWVDTSQDAYVTISEDGSAATVNNAGAVIDDGDTTATVDMTLNEDMNYGQAQDMFDAYDRDNPSISAAIEVGPDINGSPDFEDVEA
jgi:hypothetical protein